MWLLNDKTEKHLPAHDRQRDTRTHKHIHKIQSQYTHVQPKATTKLSNKKKRTENKMTNNPRLY